MYFSCRRFFVGNIFNDIAYLVHRDWPKKDFMKFIFIFYFYDTWMVLEFYIDSVKLLS